MEEPFLLAFAVARVVGGVQIDPDGLRGCVVGIQKAVHQQPVHALGVGHDLLVARLGVGIRRGQLQAIEGAGIRQCLALVALAQPILAGRIRLVGRHDRTAAEAVKLQLRCVTLRHRQALPLLLHKLLIA